MLTTYCFLAINIVIYSSTNKVYVISHTSIADVMVAGIDEQTNVSAILKS